MSDTKHTPGRYRLLEPGETIQAGDEYTLCSEWDFCGASVGHPAQEGDTIRRPISNLVAAAPDLLEALKNLITEIRAYSSPECDDEGAIGAAELKSADAAIAKAEGK